MGAVAFHDILRGDDGQNQKLVRIDFSLRVATFLSVRVFRNPYCALQFTPTITSPSEGGIASLHFALVAEEDSLPRQNSSNIVPMLRARLMAA